MRTISVLVLLSLVACQSKPKPELSGSPKVASSSVSAPQLTQAKLGAAAPDFSLRDLDGKTVSLASFKGKVVVLEWFNPECPFVRASHTKGSLVRTAERHSRDGVVWLAINSNAPGKQGHGVDVNRKGQHQFGLAHPILLDEDGRVGRAYAAERTPHLYVIDAQGILRYRGAIDNSPDGEGESPSGERLINYVDAALEDIRAGRAVRSAETKAYGCGVKYDS